MKVKFGTLVPGQMFEFQAQKMCKIHPLGPFNAWDSTAKYGLIPDEVEVEPCDHQINQTPSLMEEIVELPKAVYDAMCDEADWLASLEAAGVDNWEGYDEARRIYMEYQEEQNDDPSEP